MAATRAELEAFRGELQAARFSGTGSVRDADGSEVVYRSDAELARAIAALDRELAALDGAAAAGVTQLRLSKGL